MPETVAIASDHGGFELKTLLAPEIRALGLTVLDLGTGSAEPVDYPDYAQKVASAILEGKAARGILICGTGIGMSIAANRHRAIRAALCHDATAARLARQHNDANVLCLGGRVLGAETARDCVRIFLATSFVGAHHGPRIAKLS
jgi:ribose 5-phosphate isomerase B